MDDKAAVAAALQKRDVESLGKPRYEKVYLVFTGAADRNKIAEGMSQYLQRAEKHNPALPADWRKRTEWFQTQTNVMGKAVAHERWYKDLSPGRNLPVATGKTLLASIAKTASQKPSIDIFQLAPCRDTDVWDFINMLPNINVYHLFYGYNSRQGSAYEGMKPAESLALAERQANFHATLQQHLQTKHPIARLIFTQNVPTFSNPGAGSQSLAWCKRYFPETDIKMSLRDPFWTSLIKEANPYAAKEVQLKNIPADEDEFLNLVVNARLDDNNFRKSVHAMLESAARSETFKEHSQRSHYRVANILVGEFAGEPAPTLELGDANHITAVLEYLDTEMRGARGRSAGKLQPASCDKSGKDPRQPPNVIIGTRPSNSGWVLTGCDVTQTRNNIERLLQQR
ncbi:uncharacterized protein GLRG_11887 [Colletotrichum graminicola M1.001]|uniref:Uncharacterized protein n=1 Tax=Colletotrichum graminicola (strain M1.001 / M2 / FGSC 10212) TaxID=645133 RepID=E3R0V3_COLGM|nr:uncharacterized protein GLRG_11887 [Colletotrichum graminicola M1.001]EFQ36741.1 hypothetical protein GLRG_11887 [Colletotrichum graminicola M1.001]